MIEKLAAMARRYVEIGDKLGDPDVLRDPKRYKQMMQERAGLEDLAEAYERYRLLLGQIQDSQAMLEESDAEIRAMAKEELKQLEADKETLEQNLRFLLIPKDPLDEKNIIVEIRAGTGGDEAGLFASDLFRMYSRYAETRAWKLEVITSSDTELGGIKEVVFSLAGKGVYGSLKYESGGHRVQRVPTTENQGRIHTSACTVAILPEAEETDIVINDNDLRIDVFRSSGPGGQSVNTTDSAVRITHLPSGLVVTCQDEKSQLKNKTKAMRVLKARLFELEDQKRKAEISEQRKTMIGSGDRSERIRTYNFPQNRLTDHRINLTIYHLDRIMEGELTEIIQALQLSDKEAALKALP